MPVMQEKQMSALGLLRFKTRKPALTRFDACRAGSLLVPDAGKTNVCFGLLRFKTRKPALTRFDACRAGSLLVPDAGKTNVCFAAACFSFASSTLYHKSV